MPKIKKTNHCEAAIEFNPANEIAQINMQNRTVKQQNIWLYDDGSLKIHCENSHEKIYRPYPTIQRLRDSPKNIKLIVGQFGSGKTTGLMHLILERAARMPQTDGGDAYYKCLFIRRTYSDLKKTTYAKWRDTVRDFPIIKRNSTAPMSEIIAMHNGRNTCYANAEFLSLDRLDDQQKLRSFDVTDVFCNEFEGLPHELMQLSYERAGRYPDKNLFLNLFRETHCDKCDKRETCDKDVNNCRIFDDWSPYERYLFGDTNPPPDAHWLPEIEGTMEKQREKRTDSSEENLYADYEIFHQPPALLQDKNGEWYEDPNAENAKYMRKNYWLDMLRNKGLAYALIFACGKYGIISLGMRVYGKSFIESLHVVDEISVQENEQIIIGLDHGFLSPAATVLQFVDFQKRVLFSISKSLCDVDELIVDHVMPELRRRAGDKISTLKIVITDDPANTLHGRQKLQNHGYTCYPAKTNNIELRIGAVKNNLNRMTDGKPNIIFDKGGCGQLIDGFLGNYYYERVQTLSKNGEIEYKNLPKKNHPHSDIHDSLQYACLYCEDNKTSTLDYSSRRETT
jgi:hypothetical protein